MTKSGEGNIVPSDLDYYDPAGWATSNSALVLLKGLLSACPMDAVGVGEADGRSGKGARLVSNDSKGMYMLTVVPKVTAASLFFLTSSLQKPLFYNYLINRIL